MSEGGTFCVLSRVASQLKTNQLYNQLINYDDDDDDDDAHDDDIWWWWSQLSQWWWRWPYQVIQVN